MPEEFVELIKELRAGGSPISPIIARRLLQEASSAARGGGRGGADRVELSGRETEILSIIAKGISFAEIAGSSASLRIP